MIKRLLILTALLFALRLPAQVLRGPDLSDIGYIKEDGTVLDESKKPAGKIKKDGTVTGKNAVVIGYIKSDGTVEDESHKKLGTVKPDGSVFDADNKPIGFIKEGTVTNQNNETIGYAMNIPVTSAAVYFFFLF
ncbi:MAG: 5-fold beta-flower protein [Bacteroidia bacterium]